MVILYYYTLAYVLNRTAISASFVPDADDRFRGRSPMRNRRADEQYRAIDE